MTIEEFDYEGDYLATLEANQKLQVEITNLKQLLFHSQRKVKALEAQLNGEDDIEVVKETKPRPKPATKKKTVVIHDIEEEESDGEGEGEQDEVAEIAAPAKKQKGDKAPNPSLGAHGELMKWVDLIKLLYPGSLGTMSSKHKDRVCVLIHNFLDIHLIGHKVEECYLPNPRNPSKSILHFPVGLQDRFRNWFDKKLDNGAMDLNGRFSPKKVAKRTPALSTGVSNKNIAKNIEPESPENTHAKSPAKEKSTASHETLADFIAKHNNSPDSSKTATVTVADVQVDDLLTSDTAMTIVNILTSKYAQNVVNRLQLRSLIMKLSDARTSDEARVCEAFEKAFMPETAAKRKAPLDEVVDNTNKKAKADDEGADAIRYNQLLRKLAPDFNKAEEHKRVSLKKQVKKWLQMELGANFDTCISVSTTGGKGKEKEHKTYAIPNNLQTKFMTWARIALKNEGLL